MALNWILLVACVGLMIGFRSSSALAAASPSSRTMPAARRPFSIIPTDRVVELGAQVEI